jgi:hypothetical protein
VRVFLAVETANLILTNLRNNLLVAGLEAIAKLLADGCRWPSLDA